MFDLFEKVFISLKEVFLDLRCIEQLGTIGTMAASCQIATMDLLVSVFSLIACNCRLDDVSRKEVMYVCNFKVND